MQERILLGIGVQVPFFVREHFDVGSEDSRSCHGSGGHFEPSTVKVTVGHPEHEEQDQDEGGVNSFDSSAVEVYVREGILPGLFDDDAGDEVP